MSYFEIPIASLRSFRPDALAFADPSYPSEQFWTLWGQGPDVERASDVELNGELAVFDGPPLFTGEILAGVYETYWHSGDESAGVTILSSGSKPIGGLPGGVYYEIDRGAFAVTTREFADPSLRLPLGRELQSGAGQDIIFSPTGFGDGTIGIDVLIDANHQPCGYIFNGIEEYGAWMDRILPGEQSRVTSRELLEELQTLDPQVKVEVWNFAGSPLGYAFEFDFESSFEFAVVPEAEAHTVAELISGLIELILKPSDTIGVKANLGEGIGSYWVTSILRVGDGARVVVDPNLKLPDEPLLIRN